VQKPNGASTAWRLRSNVLLAATGSLGSAKNEEADWLNPISYVSVHITSPSYCNKRVYVTMQESVSGGSYRILCHRLYDLINSTTTYQSAALALNSRLFLQIGADAMLFLAGIVTASTFSDAAKRIALQHASAFLRAQTERKKSPIDFQTIIPSLLHVLQAKDVPIRNAAVECLEVLNDAMKAEKPSAIYGLDKVYGVSSGKISLLSAFHLHFFLMER
jgi:U3 small nucleolar RNA-associated protein 10